MNNRLISRFYNLAKELLNKLGKLDQETQEQKQKDMPDDKWIKCIRKEARETKEKLYAIVQKDDGIGSEDQWKLFLKLVKARRHKKKKFRKKAADAFLIRAFEDLVKIRSQESIELFNFLELEVSYIVPCDYGKYCLVALVRESAKSLYGQATNRASITLEVSNWDAFQEFLKLNGATKKWAVYEGDAFMVTGLDPVSSD